MRKLLVFQHVPLEPLGTLNSQFKEAGFRIRYANFDRHPGQRIDVARYDGLVVLGGPMCAADTERYRHLTYEQQAIHAAVDRRMPVLGICLGAQLMAAALGGKPLRGQAVEYGWTPVHTTPAARHDPLFAHLGGAEQIFQWHEDTFTLPRGAVHLATSAGCRNQAFRIGETAYGLQFHLEADRALIRRWLDAPGALAQLAARGIAVDRTETMRQTDRHLPRATRLAAAVFGSFIEHFYNFRRRRALPSR